jgi:hypothetical protein
MIRRIPVMANEETILIVDEAVLNGKEDIRIQVVGIPLYQLFCTDERLSTLKEPEFAIFQEAFQSVERFQLMDTVANGVDLAIESDILERSPGGNASLNKSLIIGLRIAGIKDVAYP